MFARIKSFLLENKTTKQTVAKNTIWLSISNFGGRLIKIAVIIYAARVLGTAGYGVFSYALTLAGFLTLFVDPGINGILVREGAKATPEEKSTLFSTALVMKAFVLILSVVLVITIAPMFSTLPGAKVLLPLVALIIAFDSTREFLASLFRSEEKMQLDATAFLATNLGILIFGFIFLGISKTPHSLTQGYTVGTAIGAIVALWFARKNFKEIFSKISFKKMGWIIKSAWPFAITSALGILFTNTDILMISWLRNASDVGIYSAAIRIIQVLYLIPTVVQMSTLPVFSRLAKNDHQKFRNALEQIVSILFMISIPLSLGGIILGKQIMGFVFGPAYVAGGLAFSILMLNMSFDYVGAVIANGIFSYDRQKIFIITSAIGGIGNVVFDLLLIPHWGMEGSAIATLFAQILSNSYLWYAMKKINQFHVLDKMKKVAFAGIIMALFTELMSFVGIHLIANIIISGAIYFGILLMLKEPLIKEAKRILVNESI